MIKIDLHPNKDKLRQFGMAGGLFAGAFALLVYYSIGSFAGMYGIKGIQITLTVSIIATLLSILAPEALKPLYLLLTLLAWPIGYVISHVILFILYYIVLTPVAIVFKMIGRDALHRKFDHSAKTYWEPCETDIPAERYFRQF